MAGVSRKQFFEGRKGLIRKNVLEVRLDLIEHYPGKMIQHIFDKRPELCMGLVYLGKYTMAFQDKQKDGSRKERVTDVLVFEYLT